MNIARRLGFLVAVMALVVVAAQSGSSDNTPPLSEHGESPWTSPRMSRLRTEWESLRQIYKNTHDKGLTISIMTDSLLRKRLSERDVSELAASCDDLPIRVENDTFSRDVLAFLVTASAELKERDKLVDILAIRCPRWVEWPVSIESFLASRSKVIKDPIVVLGDAYSKSRVPETQRDLAAAVHRAFQDFEIDGDDDAQYVDNAMIWYRKEKPRFEVNDRYTFNETTISPRRPLFALIESSKTEMADKNSARQTSDPSVVNDIANTQTPAGNRSAEEELAQIAGKWDVVEVSIERENLTERFKGSQVVFDKDSMTTIIVQDGGKTTLHTTVRLGLQDKLRTIDTVGTKPNVDAGNGESKSLVDELRQEISRGIYRLEGDTLRICTSRPDAMRRPTSFATEAGSGTTVLVLKRSKE